MCRILNRWNIWPCNAVRRVLLCLPKTHVDKPCDDAQCRASADEAYTRELAEVEARRPDDDPELRENKQRLEHLQREAEKHYRYYGIRFERDVQIRRFK